MELYNLKSLLTRQLPYSTELPDGRVEQGTYEECVPVSIPQIQRDYAEGRQTEDVVRKRLNLLNDMLDVLYGARKTLSFDFVYGSVTKNGQVCVINGVNDYSLYKGSSFEPLDGQQRLTTLFLIHWLFGRNDDIRRPLTKASLIYQSLFVYKTRPTSEEFCNWLVEKQAKDIVAGWGKQVDDVRKRNEYNRNQWSVFKNSQGIIDPVKNRLKFPVKPLPSLLDYFKSQDDFKWDWHNDPNIKSMIVVIEHALTLIKEKGWTYDDGVALNGNLDNINFLLLDNLDCDGDSLFEKMNARGKSLTSFEILKSSLEEEMERQNGNLSSSGLIDKWRNRMDGDWIDYCWDNSNISSNPTLESIRSVEKKMEKLIVRLVGKSYFDKPIVGTPPVGESKDYRDEFEKSLSNRVDEAFDYYLDYVRHERSLKTDNYTPLDFQCIHDDMNNLLYKDNNGKWRDASVMLPQYHRDNKNTLMDDFMGNGLTHSTRVAFYAMTRYLSIRNADVVYRDQSGTEKANFTDWMRFVRNICNIDNANSHFDNISDVRNAVKIIDSWLNEYSKSYLKGQKNDMLTFISEYLSQNVQWKESRNIREEAIKAELRLNGSQSGSGKAWEESILDAERHPYLWGQIIAPLSWSMDSTGDYDISKFNEYITCFQNARLQEGTSTDYLFIQAFLCENDKRPHYQPIGQLGSHGSLGRFDFDRDHSWKRYLRNKHSSGVYGYFFKVIFDEWMQSGNQGLSFENLLVKFIGSRKGSILKTDWRYYIVNYSDPMTLRSVFESIRTTNRYLHVDGWGTAFLFRSDSTRTTNRFEVLTTYLQFESSILQPNVVAYDLKHQADINGAQVKLKNQSGDIAIISSTGSQYAVEFQGNTSSKMINLSKCDVEKALVNNNFIKGL